MIGWLNVLAGWEGILSATRAVLESNFTTALIGSLAGALGGAWAAQRIAERSKLRNELLEEIRRSNAAASMLYGIANSHLGLKRQHVHPMFSRFFEQKKEVEAFLVAKAAGRVPPKQEIQYQLDLEKLQPLSIPIEEAKTLVFDKISISGGVLLVMPLLMGLASRWQAPWKIAIV